MATKNYLINDKWLDINKQNIVELQSVDGVLDTLKVNGSEIVTPSGKITITENGTDIDVAQYALADVNVEGGSSDLTMGNVIFINSAQGRYYTISSMAFIYGDNDTIDYNPNVDVSEQETFNIVIYKGSQFIPLTKFTGYDVQTMPIVTGDIEFVTSPSYGFIVSGDGTITAKGTTIIS